MYVGLRPTTSDVEDQPNRPLMLHSDSRPTNPAAAAALTLGKKSWIIGAACSRMPMPAVTLQNRTVQSSQNCGVLIAFVAVTFPPQIIERAPRALGVPPPGCQPPAGALPAPPPGHNATKEKPPRTTDKPTNPAP